jgi:hypothetical protein
MESVNGKKSVSSHFIQSVHVRSGQLGVSSGIDLESTERFEEPDRRHPRIKSSDWCEPRIQNIGSGLFQSLNFLKLNNVIKVKGFFYFGSIFYQEKVEVASSPSVFAEFDLDQQKSVTLKISKLKETLNSIQTVFANTSSKSVLLIERQLDKSLQ